MKQLRIFFSGAWYSYMALFAWTTPSTYLAAKVGGPLGMILFFTVLGVAATGRESAQFYIVGNAMQMVAINGIFGVTTSVGGERGAGTLDAILGTPANRLSIFLGRAFFHILDGMVTVAIGFLWGVVLLGLDLSAANLPGLVLVVLITAISTCGFGLLLGSLSLITVNIMFVNNFVYVALLLLSGANVPLVKLPVWMQSISAVLPLTRGITAARLFVQGAHFEAVMPLLFGELTVGIVYGILGYLGFRWLEFQAKRLGTLELF